MAHYPYKVASLLLQGFQVPLSARLLHQNPENSDILLIEDDELVQFMVRRRLRDSGLKLAVCETSDEGQAFLARQQVPLLLMDLRLPDRDGDVLLATLVAEQLVVDTAIYVCTSARPHEDICRKIESLGACILLKEVILEKGRIPALYADATGADRQGRTG